VKQPNKNCPINWTEFYIYFLREVEGKHYINVRLLRRLTPARNDSQ